MKPVTITELADYEATRNAETYSRYAEDIQAAHKADMQAMAGLFQQVNSYFGIK